MAFISSSQHSSSSLHVDDLIRKLRCKEQSQSSFSAVAKIPASKIGEILIVVCLKEEEAISSGQKLIEEDLRVLLEKVINPFKLSLLWPGWADRIHR